MINNYNTSISHRKAEDFNYNPTQIGWSANLKK